MPQNALIRKYWLNCLQFLAICIFTIGLRIELPSLSGIVMWFGLSFFLLLYIVCIYEIPIKLGLKRGFSKNRIAVEVVIVWIIPLMFGYVLSGVLAA